MATLRHFRAAGLSADSKEDGRFDPVTVADRLSEDMMREVLARRRPQDGILGEERPPVAGTSGLTWVLDPIDGTRGYLSGTPTWGVLVAVADARGPIYGLIDQPFIGERFEGGLGRAEVTGPMGAVCAANAGGAGAVGGDPVLDLSRGGHARRGGRVPAAGARRCG